MNADGTNMHQISFNTNHDFAPSVLANGQIVFSRWEVTNGTDQISLYRVTNPDGTGLQLYYGANSHATGANIAGTNDNVIQFLNARQRADGKLIAIDRPFLGTQLGGDILLIDAANSWNPDQLPNGPAGSDRGPAKQRHHAGRHHGREHALAGRPLCLGLSALRRHQPHAGELGPCLVTNTGHHLEVCNSSAIPRRQRATGAPAVHLWIYDFDAGTLSPVLSASPARGS
jgi:hypothetical protein